MGANQHWVWAGLAWGKHMVWSSAGKLSWAKLKYRQIWMKRNKKTMNGTSGLKFSMAKANEGKAAAGRWRCTGMENGQMDSGGLWSGNDYTMFRHCIGAINVEGNGNKGPKSSQPRSHAKHMRRLPFCNRLCPNSLLLVFAFWIQNLNALISWGCQLKFNLVVWCLDKC